MEQDPYLEMDDPDHWALSGVLGGSPGKPNNTEAGRLPVVVNEALFLSPVGERWVELYNRGDSPIDLSGYILSTERTAEAGSVLPPETEIAPRRWLASDASHLQATAQERWRHWPARRARSCNGRKRRFGSACSLPRGGWRDRSSARAHCPPRLSTKVRSCQRNQ